MEEINQELFQGFVYDDLLADLVGFSMRKKDDPYEISIYTLS